MSIDPGPQIEQGTLSTHTAARLIDRVFKHTLIHERVWFVYGDRWDWHYNGSQLCIESISPQQPYNDPSVVYLDDVFYCPRCETFWQGKTAQPPKDGWIVDIEALPAFIEEHRDTPEWEIKPCPKRLAMLCDSGYRRKWQREQERKESAYRQERWEKSQAELAAAEANLERFRPLANLPKSFDHLPRWLVRAHKHETEGCPIETTGFLLMDIIFFYGPMNSTQAAERWETLNWPVILLKGTIRFLNQLIRRNMKNGTGIIKREASAETPEVIKARKIPKIKNIDDLVNSLCELYENTAAGTQDLAEAKQLNDTANRIITALRTQVVYQELQSRPGGGGNVIKFLEGR